MTDAGRYFALCIQDAGNEMVAAECAALTGREPDADGFVLCQSVEEAGRAAYLRFGAELLAKAETRAGLLCEIERLRVQAEAFRVEVVTLPGGETIAGRGTEWAVADLIHGGPQLVNPVRRFVVVSRRDGFWFGEILQISDSLWQKHDDKPLRTSSSLPSRLSRAIVNRAVQAGDVALNPCCGTGSFLLEAASMGVEAYGLDHNPGMVRMSRTNVAHFGYTAPVEQGEAIDWNRKGDMVLADLPYDRNCKTTEANVREILAASARLAPRAVFIAEIDLTEWLADAGYSEVKIYKVRKTPRFTRYVHEVKIST